MGAAIVLAGSRAAGGGWFIIVVAFCVLVVAMELSRDGSLLK